MNKLTPLATGSLKAIRTDCITKQSKEVDIEYAIYNHERYPNEFVFQITKGAVTGYENFIFQPDDNKLLEMAKRGWCGCTGDIGCCVPIYDKLEVPATEMAKVKFPQPTETDWIQDIKQFQEQMFTKLEAQIPTKGLPIKANLGNIDLKSKAIEHLEAGNWVDAANCCFLLQQKNGAKP